MEYDPMRPIWVQVVAHIKTDLVTGVLKPGEKMPSGRDLALKYTINPNTAARVYQALESEGLCGTRRGLGTFVTADADRIASLRQEMAREALARCLRTLSSLGVSRAEAVRMITEEE